MNIIFLLAPFSVALGLLAVVAFVWTLRSGQYEDVKGAAARILLDDGEALAGNTVAKSISLESFVAAGVHAPELPSLIAARARTRGRPQSVPPAVRRRRRRLSRRRLPR